MPNKLKILFLCTGNACRSQMAEGWARHLLGDRVEPYSAGVLAAGLSQKTVAVMAEAGVDISAARSKSFAEFENQPFDCVVVLCANVWRLNPSFPAAARTLFAPFDDPVALKYTVETPGQVLDIYRRVRDEIRAFIAGLPETLGQG